MMPLEHKDRKEESESSGSDHDPKEDFFHANYMWKHYQTVSGNLTKK